MMEYVTTDITYPAMPVVLSHTYYEYNVHGNVTRIITEHDPEGGGSTLLGGGGAGDSSSDEGSGESLLLGGPCGTGETYYTATRFGYADNGSAVTFMHDESTLDGRSPAILGTTLPPWSPRRCWDGVSNCLSYPPGPTDYNITWGREFRYDSARAKYLVRELDPNALETGSIAPLTGDWASSSTWSDYDGEEIYGDYRVTAGNPSTVENVMSYEPGIGRHHWSGGSPPYHAEEYHHADHLGTLREVTVAEGTPEESRVFTAFGELVSGPLDRLGYVGAFGYQRDPDFTFLHVGARWYDPATGRFLQRDPTGMGAGLNVYEYVRNRPAQYIDPMGLQYVGPTGKEEGFPGPPPPYDPSKDKQPGEELEGLKKSIYLQCALTGLGGFAYWPLAAGTIIAAVIDEMLHPDEPLNPIWGGSYEPTGNGTGGAG